LAGAKEINQKIIILEGNHYRALQSRQGRQDKMFQTRLARVLENHQTAMHGGEKES